MDAPKIELIAEDFRGASYSLTFPDNTEMVIIYSKKGVYRGGHSHDRPETSMLLSGKVKYWKKFLDGREIEFIEYPGETLRNGAGEIHLSLFLENSWLMDWKIDTKKLESVTTNYAPYRDKVDAQMKEFKEKGFVTIPSEAI